MDSEWGYMFPFPFHPKPPSPSWTHPVLSHTERAPQTQAETVQEIRTTRINYWRDVLQFFFPRFYPSLLLLTYTLYMYWRVCVCVCYWMLFCAVWYKLFKYVRLYPPFHQFAPATEKHTLESTIAPTADSRTLGFRLKCFGWTRAQHTEKREGHPFSLATGFGVCVCGWRWSTQLVLRKFYLSRVTKKKEKCLKPWICLNLNLVII